MGLESDTTLSVLAFGCGFDLVKGIATIGSFAADFQVGDGLDKLGNQFSEGVVIVRYEDTHSFAIDSFHRVLRDGVVGS